MSQPTLYSEIIARLQDKQEKQHIEITLSFPDLHTMRDKIWLGTFSWYLEAARRRLLLRPFAYQFPEVYATPGDLARSYLDVKYKKQRATGEQARNFLIPRSAPLYVQPHECEEGVYIDIKSAYWQILQIIGWDVDYNPGLWLGKGQPMADFPFADMKLTRNCLVTAGLPNEHQIWNGHKERWENGKRGNVHANRGVWACVNDILHGVARDCIAAGAFYVHTDGYICEHGRYDAVLSALEAWGLKSSIKATGQTTVWGVGAYSVGSKLSKTPRHKSQPFDGVRYDDYYRWLRERVKFFSDRTEFKWVSDYLPINAPTRINTASI